MSIADAAWLAGYIDGDGCICLYSQGSKTKRKKAVVAIDSADWELLEFVQKIAGGSLISKPKAAEHHRPCKTWRLLGAKNIKLVLSQVLPYLKCEFKKERARMLVQEWNDCTPRNGFYTPELSDKKRSFEERFAAIGVGRGSRNRIGL